MSNNSVKKLSNNIDNLIKEINNLETINCSKNSELINKSYVLFLTVSQAVLKKCSLEELNGVFNILLDNLYHDTIGKPINKTKRKITDIYKKTFYTIPDLIKKIKVKERR